MPSPALDTVGRIERMDGSPIVDGGSIHVRVEPRLKREVEAILSSLGLTPGDAITLFYEQIRRDRGLPDSVRVPNAETLEAMRQAEVGEDLTTYESVDDLMAELEAL